MLRAIIIDDEEHCRNEIKALLLGHEDVDIIAEGDCVKSGIKQIQKYQPDLIFLDIEMPDGTGFDLINAFEEPNFQIIFTTGHNDYAIKAFRLSAVDYLLKPIEGKELINAIDRAKFLHGKKENFAKMDLLIKSLEKKEFTKIAIPSMEGFDIINKCDIIYCEADSNYTTVQLTGDRKIVSSYTLKRMDDTLNEDCFYRIHKSFIVNIDFVAKVMKGTGGEVVMQDGTKIPIARRKKDRLMELIGI